MQHETRGEQDVERETGQQQSREAEGEGSYGQSGGETGGYGQSGGETGIGERSAFGLETGTGYTGEESGRDLSSDPREGMRSDEERFQGASLSDEERGTLSDEERG